ncbi:MAG: hypothetical protein AB7U45_12080 [Desulfamplus sp.]
MNKNQLMEALLIVFDEFEEHPISDWKANATLMEILAERLEQITTGTDRE